MSLDTTAFWQIERAARYLSAPQISAWDERKNRINRRKHGIAFETAARIFEDPNIVSCRDRIGDDEERWHAIGLAGGIAILFVVHTSEEQHGEEKSASSQQERRVPASALLPTSITDKQRRELQRADSASGRGSVRRPHGSFLIQILQEMRRRRLDAPIPLDTLR